MKQEHRDQDLIQAKYLLKPGFILVTKTPTLISAVLGSGVAVAVFDRKRGFGGMNHFQYPAPPASGQTTARYGNVATWALVKTMLAYGSKPKHLEAQIVGGAENPETPSDPVARENIRAAQNILRKLKIQSVSQDIGGRKGRKVVFNTATNELVVMKVDRLRQGDWYPYESDR